MAEEQKNPEEETINGVEETVEEVVSEVEATAEEAVETVEEASVEAEVGAEMLAEDVEEAIETVAEAVEETVEEVAEEAETVMQDIEEAAQSPEIMVAAEELVDGHGHHDDEPHYSDDVVLPYFGHVATMPGGIYTFIFGVLGVITLVEVLMTELLPENAFTIFLLVVLSLAKAYLVIMYYMHLNNDNPLYRVVILLPLLVVLVSVLYLLGVPIGAGLGYN
ncbi:MAG: cytochrome C oxidase subunit IV family protein [Chloroflexota bacterium]